MSQKLYLIFLIFLSTVLFVQNSFSQCQKDYLDKYLIDSSRKLEKESFIGLKKISIVVHVQPRTMSNIINEDSLKSIVEEQLRQKSTFELAENTDATFRIDIKSVTVSKDVIWYFVEASLTQSSVLERDKTKSILYLAPTWKRSDCGYSAVPEIQSLYDKVKELVDEFISDSLPDLSKLQANNKKESSPFTATYVGGNRPPELEVFNDSDRTLYFDFGQEQITAYTIPPKTTKRIELTEGIYKYKAIAQRVSPLEGQGRFQKGYVYTWRFTIVRFSIPR